MASIETTPKPNDAPFALLLSTSKKTQNWGLFSARELIRFYFVRATIIVRLPRPEMNNSNYESGSPGPQ